MLESFEKNLPVELSFLIRQQAICMARMNKLDRQIRELKETNKLHSFHGIANSNSSRNTISNSANLNPHNHHHHHHHHHQHNSNNQIHPHLTSALQNDINHQLTNTTPQNQNHLPKNGNFIHSDDSGGEFSRATVSDDDELSSLLDQIAKSVRPERNLNQAPNHTSINQHQMAYNQRAHFSQYNSTTMLHSSKSQQPPYAIINPSQLHHHHQATTAVPVFVMSSPIAVAHPSSISSTVLPGVHFQPEPRYNQYYEDLYVQNSSPSATTLNKHQATTRDHNRQFDTSISAIEQLVSQRENKQIKSQLKCADNWLKMRSSGIGDLVSNNLGHASASSHVGSNSDEAALNAKDSGCAGQSGGEDRIVHQNLSSTIMNDKKSCLVEDN